MDSKPRKGNGRRSTKKNKAKEKYKKNGKYTSRGIRHMNSSDVNLTNKTRKRYKHRE